MESAASHDNDYQEHDQEPDHDQLKETSNGTNGASVVYTPVSTVPSSSNTDATCDEGTQPDTGDPTDENNAVWGEWWKAEELATQVGSLSKDLTELKEMVAKQNFDEEANVSSVFFFVFLLGKKKSKI
jgi:hypothetical protein